jgi:hypothetical protein
MMCPLNMVCSSDAERQLLLFTCDWMATKETVGLMHKDMNSTSKCRKTSACAA